MAQQPEEAMQKKHKATDSDIVTEKQLMQVAVQIGTARRQIGILLGIAEVELQQIESDYPRNHVDRVYQMLLLWRKKKKNPTAVQLHTELTGLGDLVPDEIDFLLEERLHVPNWPVTEGLLVGGRPITYYEDELQDNMSSEQQSPCVTLGSEPEKVFIPTHNVDIKATDIHSHHEVRRMEMNKPGDGTHIQPGKMHRDPSGRNIKTVLTVGSAGIGKTFLILLFLSDWAKKCFPQDPHLVFPLKFRQLNLLKGKIFTLAQLIHHCIKETRSIAEDVLNDIFKVLQKSVHYNKSPFKVMIIMDGYDENDFQFDFKENLGLMNVVDPYPVEHLLLNLIKGELLPSAHIWITSRPAASIKIPKVFVNRMTEVRGFIRDDQKKEFFTKSISDENQANSVYSHIKKSKILHTMCEIPVFCWFLARVVMSMKMKYKLPKTLTEMYRYFLIGEILREKTQDLEVDEEDKRKLIKDAREVLLKLGELAFHQLVKGKIIFYEEDLKACGLDVIKDLLISDFCTTFFKEDDVFFRQTVYCFVHLSLQEFLAAVYLFHCFTQENKSLWFHRFTQRTRRNRKVLKTFLGTSRVSSLDDFLKRAMQKTLQSESGHLDLFVRFLHGLSLEDNQSLLGQTKNSPEEIQRAINNLKEMSADEDLSPDGCINIFHCLMEMNDPSVSQGIQQYLESESRSGKELTETQCSALASMLLMSEKVLEELDLDKYNTGDGGRMRLIPAVRNCTTARLVGFGRFLLKEHIEVVASALSSNPSHLRHLDISYNHLARTLDLLCDALRSPHCRLETLRLMNCWLSERSCELLASALRSNPLREFHLRELDLTFNVLPVSGLEKFSGLETLKVKHGGELWTNPQLPTQYSHRLTLDPNTASRTLCLSDHNRKVTRSKGEELQPYPDHPDRFSDDVHQVLCSEGLSGGRYLWEVEWSGGVDIGGAYRAISRRGKDSGLGYNDHSWSLFCTGGFYSVIHNSRGTDLPVRPSVYSRAVGETGESVSSRAVGETGESVSSRAVGETGESVSSRAVGETGESVSSRAVGETGESVSTRAVGETGESVSSRAVGETGRPVYRVAVYLDCPAGTLSFYDVSSDSLTHIYTVQNLTGPLYPGFSVYNDSSVCLCEDRQRL